jgi:hypothetical protein
MTQPCAATLRAVATAWKQYTGSGKTLAHSFDEILRQRAESITPSRENYPDDGGLKEPVRDFNDTTSLQEVVKEHFGISDRPPAEAVSGAPEILVAPCKWPDCSCPGSQYDGAGARLVSCAVTKTTMATRRGEDRAATRQTDGRVVPNSCSICGKPILGGSFVGTGDGSMRNGGSFAHYDCYMKDRPPAEAAGRGGDTVDEHGGSLSTKVGESPWSGARAAAQPPKESGGTQSASPPTSPAGEERDLRNGIVITRHIDGADQHLSGTYTIDGKRLPDGMAARPPDRLAARLRGSCSISPAFNGLLNEAADELDRMAARMQELEGEVARLDKLANDYGTEAEVGREEVSKERQRAESAEREWQNAYEAHKAVVAERDACKERLEKLARWIVREADQREGRAKPFPVIYDHACARCGGSLTADHFVCAVHMARDFVASLAATDKEKD